MADSISSTVLMALKVSQLRTARKNGLMRAATARGGQRRGDRESIEAFLYITNRTDKVAKIVGLANGRCDQENVIEQMENGVNAMRMPVNDLLSNWAYMVMAALAWNLKAWYGLLTPNRERGLELVKMEFRRFLHAIVLLPCQIVRTARRGIYRILGYNNWSKDFFATWERVRQMAPVSASG
jgi:hypothetical protein